MNFYYKYIMKLYMKNIYNNNNNDNNELKKLTIK